MTHDTCILYTLRRNNYDDIIYCRYKVVFSLFDDIRQVFLSLYNDYKITNLFRIYKNIDISITGNLNVV